jgi:DHA1 family bicyclomycin/chloramphenicol resistance-like MFS transporter
LVAHKHSKWMIVYLGTLIAFGPVSIDLYLAALPTIRHYFSASTSDTQLTLSLFFLGFALAQLFWGPLSDRLGRKPTIFIGLGVYLLGTVACYWAPDINTLIIGRLLQGIGGTCGVVMAIAMVKDLYADDHESAKVFTLVFSVMAVAPVIAPVIGSHFLAWFGWRSCFAFLLIYAVILIICTVALPEPYPVTKRRPLPVKRIVAEYALQLVYRPFLLIVLSAACAFSIMFAFIASSPYMYIDMVGLSAQWYGYCFGIAAAFIIVGNLTLNRLRLKMTDMRVIAFGMGIMLGGGMLLVILQMTVPHHVLSVLLPGVLIMFGTGILLPQLLAISMGHTCHFNGIASALIGTIRFGAGGVVTFFAAHWVGTTAVLVGVAVLILLVIMAVLTQLYCRT